MNENIVPAWLHDSEVALDLYQSVGLERTDSTFKRCMLYEN